MDVNHILYEMMEAYRPLCFTIVEARMTRKQLGAEADELVGKGIESARGYNYSRAKKEFRRAERRGADPLTNKDVENMSATGVAQSAGGRRGIIGRLAGRAEVRLRSRGQGRNQNIGGMERQMKKDPEAFAPPTRTTADPNNPYHEKPTQIGGRTRQALHRLIRKKPMPTLTIPSQRHARSATRARKWIASGGQEKRAQELASVGKRLRGQDPRLTTKTDKTLRDPEGVKKDLESRKHA